VRRLIDAELLAVVQGRGERGTFGASTYRVSLPANILVCAARPDDLHAHERRAHRRSPSNTSASVEQLALLPE